MDRRSHALVLFSGGQDSATCLAWALSRYDLVETAGFRYGQRHAVELSAREVLRAHVPALITGAESRLGADHLLDLSALGDISETAMTRDAEITTRADGLPTTFVPGRNLMFLVMAAALAFRRGAGTLVAGMCETDFSGYPDCRRAVLDTQMEAINAGMAMTLTLQTPLMALDKAATWALAETLGGPLLVELIRTASHTCYRGVRDVLHDWGYGCGTCPACVLRARGWADFRAGTAGDRP